MSEKTGRRRCEGRGCECWLNSHNNGKYCAVCARKDENHGDVDKAIHAILNNSEYKDSPARIASRRKLRKMPGRA